MKLYLLILFVFAISSSFGAVFLETEANNSLGAGNVFSGVSPGDTISGASGGGGGPSYPDHFEIKLALQKSAIYFNTIALSSPLNSGFSGSIRGATSNVIVPTETTLQGGYRSAGFHFNNWYSFGTEQTLNYRVTGSSAASIGYTATISQSVVTPTSLGTVQAGSLNINTTGESLITDTELFLYDSNMNLMAWNDDIDGSSLQGSGSIRNLNSRINANLEVGTYYIALGRNNTAANVAAFDLDTPAFPTSGGIHLSPNILTASNGLEVSGINLNFGSTQVATTSFIGNSEYGQVRWYSVEAVPEPATMTVFGLGLAALTRRRKCA